MRDVTVHQKRDGWTAVKTRKKKSDDKPPRQECHSLSTMSFQSNDCNLQSYAHLVYITPSLKKEKEKSLPSIPRTPLGAAEVHFLSIKDLTSTINVKACRCRLTIVPTEQTTQNLTRTCFPGDGRPWTEQHLWRAAAELGACLLSVVALYLPGCNWLHWVSW